MTDIVNIFLTILPIVVIAGLLYFILKTIGKRKGN